MTDSPRAYREKNPYTPPPPEYKPPSLIVEHWRLATLLALVCIAFAVYCLKAPHAPRAASGAPPTQPTPAQPPRSAQPERAAPPAPDGSPAGPIYIETIAPPAPERKP